MPEQTLRQDPSQIASRAHEHLAEPQLDFAEASRFIIESQIDGNPPTSEETHPGPEPVFTILPNGMNFLRTTSDALETELPQELFSTTENGKGRPVVNFAPAALDVLPVGEYWIVAKRLGSNIKTSRLSVHEDEVSGDRYVRARLGTKRAEDNDSIVQASDTAYDRYDAPDFLGADGVDAFVWAVPGRIETSHRSLIKKVGFVTEPDPLGGETVVGSPTPETLKRKCKEWGVSIKLVDSTDDKGVIPLTDYVSAFAEGSYPVGIGGSLLMYNHDVINTDDHFVGVLGGGQEMLDTLRPLAAEAIALDPQGEKGVLLEIGECLDDITSLVTNSLANAMGRRAGQHVTGQLESKYKVMCQSVNTEYQEGMFSSMVLNGFLSTGRRLGWDENTLEKIRSQITIPVIAA